MALYVKLPISLQRSVPYPAAMAATGRFRPAFGIFYILSGLAMVTTPANVVAAPRAQLVHCGNETCLRISGRRPHSAVAVRIAGQDLTVEGERNWRTTVSLRSARDWMNAPGDTLTLTLADTRTGTETMEAVSLPPGALGKRIELATLVVRAY